jgi:hypothetical protein
MHQVDDAIVRDGSIVLSHLPFADGQHVRVIIAERGALAGRAAAAADAPAVAPVGRLSIHDVRRQLAGGVEGLDDPGEPMIPEGDWEMLK